MIRLRLLPLLLLGLLALPASAQQVPLQSGPVTAGHAPMYVNSGNGQPVIQDSGPAAGGQTGLGMGEGLYIARGTGTPPYIGQGTGPSGTNWCDYDAPISNPAGYHFLCLSANAQGGGLMVYGAGGIATPLPLSVIINGVQSSWATVTSVGLSMPAEFSVAGSPVTSSGTLAATWASESANRVLASPNGTSGTPGFRALVSGDMPLPGPSSLGAVNSHAAVTHQFITQIGTDGAIAAAQPAFTDVSGTATIAQGGTGQTSANAALNALLPSQTGNAGKGLFTDGTNATWTPVSGSGTVTSVALTAPSEFAVTGSPVTASGTLALAWANPVTVAHGGTGLASGTSGGIPYFSGTTSIASSGALTASHVVLGGGAGASPTVLASLGTTTTLLHGNAAGAPTFAAVALATDVSGQLPTANGGTGAANLNGIVQAGTTNTITTGYTLTPFNIGTVTTGTTTLSGANGNYQYMTDNGASTIAAPAADTAIDVLITNGASAGTLTFSGFTVGSNTGDTFDTVNGHKFLLNVIRINGTSTYLVKALQ
jgi:hypothetical protein